ncbi:hypothetical protein HL033_03960 [Neoehrlichia mikurensis]|uniref:Uncharacterized protein n=1 Tax=Neoehrlichia mikurensis TaxID=89586 RepID=A0A9Q9F3L3_9RICK|nr:hypothetical protein [Neoehrlichia mikurensis]QXK91880.1 hypothetical protein IAH97_03955 [Neoehrlichia mikurensis]QXK93093.1 hypothetical protein HUN61_03950 [Neoehrlichia mikurensis]QXK93573.1 hypothetical protein HL033_03960 [Neoehrlichia mikurensis]UTO55474.1 hypothetical protein LUA82_04920 [Neoehrlichia mikurensis]UTO56394.1 hypothetical protein LUA81_04865 [Neoehrlichia mikurensis]
MKNFLCNQFTRLFFYIMTGILLYFFYNVKYYEITIIGILLGIVIIILGCYARWRYNVIQKNKNKCQNVLSEIRSMELKIYLVKSRIKDYFTFFSYLYNNININDILHVKQKYTLYKNKKFKPCKQMITIIIILLIVIFKYFIDNNILKSYTRELSIIYSILFIMYFIVGLNELIFIVNNISLDNSKENKKYSHQYKLLHKQLLTLEKEYQILIYNIECYNQDFNIYKDQIIYKSDSEKDQIKQKYFLEKRSDR